MSYEGSDHTTQTCQPGVNCDETSVGCLNSSSTSTVPCCVGDGNDDTLKIAWRYKNLQLPVEFFDNFYSVALFGAFLSHNN